MRRLSIALVLWTCGGAVAAESKGTLHKIKQREQKLEKKVEAERDRPDKKGRAKQVVGDIESNIRKLGRELQGVVKEAEPKAEPKAKAKGNNGKRKEKPPAP